MKNDPRTPPRLFSRLLGRSIPEPNLDEVLGDLHEEFLQLSQTRGATRARWWYAGEAIRLVARAVAARAAGRGSPSPPLTPNPGDSFMRTIGSEVRRAFRTLLQRPALTALIVVPLALGLGANAAIFALIDAVILRPFTIPGVDRVVMIAQTAPGSELDIRETVSPANYLDWKKSIT